MRVGGGERILLVKQRGAVLEVIRRLNPVKCVPAYRVFLRDNSCLFQCVCHILFIYLSLFPPAGLITLCSVKVRFHFH